MHIQSLSATRSSTRLPRAIGLAVLLLAAAGLTSLRPLLWAARDPKLDALLAAVEKGHDKLQTVEGTAVFHEFSPYFMPNRVGNPHVTADAHDGAYAALRQVRFYWSCEENRYFLEERELFPPFRPATAPKGTGPYHIAASYDGTHALQLELWAGYARVYAKPPSDPPGFGAMVFLVFGVGVGQHESLERQLRAMGTREDSARLELRGEEVVAGERCVGLSCVDGSATESWWLAPERDYRCAKYELATKSDTGAAVDQCTVESWMQCSGLWLPRKWRRTQHQGPAGALKWQWTQTCDIVSCRANREIPQCRFRPLVPLGVSIEIDEGASRPEWLPEESVVGGNMAAFTRALERGDFPELPERSGATE